MKLKELILLDLFSGAGGFALGLKKAGFSFSHHYYSEIDPYAIQNYSYNFPKAIYLGGVQQINTKEIETPDIVTFGFPCQDVSVSGKREGLSGKRSGLFFEALRIIKELKPRAFVFENVKGLFSSGKGKDFETVLKAVADLGLYNCQWQLLDTAWFLPQHRERIYFVGTIREAPAPEVFPFFSDDQPNQKNHHQENKRVKGNFLSYDAYHRDGIDKVSQSSRIFYPSRHCSTLSCQTDIKIYEGKGIRRLTPLEWERLQGFPDDWTKYGIKDENKIEIANTHRYELMGNAVSVPVVQALGKRMLPLFSSGKEKTVTISNTLEKEAEELLGILGEKNYSLYAQKPEVILFGTDEKKSNTKISVPEITLTYSRKQGSKEEKISRSEDAEKIIRSKYPPGTIQLQEQIYVLYLDHGNHVIGYYHHSSGGISATVADPRIILAAALKSLATSMILAHNHPSGALYPSDADKKLTSNLRQSSSAMEIKLLDHLIITPDSYTSFADQGLLSGTLDKTGKYVESKKGKSSLANNLEQVEDTSDLSLEAEALHLELKLLKF